MQHRDETLNNDDKLNVCIEAGGGEHDQGPPIFIKFDVADVDSGYFK